MRQVAVLLGLLMSCGSPKVREVLVREKPKTLEVGESAHFILDTSKSSNLLSSGTLDISVTTDNGDTLTFEGRARVQSVIGEKIYDVRGDVEKVALTPQFLSELRVSRVSTLRNTTVTYVSLSDEGCDTVSLSEIRGYPDLTLTPTVCLSARTVPSVAVTARQGKLTVDAYFQATD